MSKEEYLKLAEEKWSLIENLKKEKSFYEYEKKFDAIMIELGRELLEKSISDVPEDRRKKKKLRRDMVK